MPEVTQDFGWTTNLRNMFGQASMDFWATVKSPVFVLVIGFGLFNSFMSLMFQTESGYGLESLPVTYNQISIIRGQLYIFLIAVYVTLAKGIAIGRIETAWGLWLFTACVLGSLALGVWTGRIVKTGPASG